MHPLTHAAERLQKVNTTIMTNDELLSKTISYLRFPLIVLVVFAHFSLNKGLDIHGTKYGLENPDWFFFIVDLISETLARIVVPLFFIISGFLFFNRKDFNKDAYKLKLKSRVKTLFVPYILWNIIAILWQLKCLIPILSSFFLPVEIHISFTRIFNTFFCNYDNGGIIVRPSTTGSSTGLEPINVPLWYLRDLMVMIILSPVFHWLIKRIGVWFVVIDGFIWFCLSLITPKDGYIWIYIIAMLVTDSFFFSWGAYFSITKENIVTHFRKFKFAPVLYAGFAIADVLTKGMDVNSFVHRIGILLGIVSAVVIVSYLLEHKKVKVNTTLANSTFFIYALHGLFIGELGKVIFIMLHIPDNNPYAMLILYFVVPIISVLVCLALYVLLKNYSPKVCNLLTGGR